MPQQAQPGNKRASAAASGTVSAGPDSSTARSRQRWLDGATVLGPAAACLALYLHTLAPTVVEGDSSELVAAIHVLGIPHPTGYPLYMLLGKAFEMLVPIGGAAYRVNLMSAVCASAMVALLALLALKITSSRPAAVLAAAVGGLSEPAWSQAVIAEVYALHGLLVVLVLLAFWRWHLKRTWREISWLSAAAGLGLAHHRTIIFFAAPALLAAIGWQRPFQPAGLGKAVAAGLAPLAFYAYLPLRAMANPPVNWGNPATWDNFWYHVTASIYVQFAFGHTLPETAQRFWTLVREMGREISWPGLLAAVAGAVLMARNAKVYGLTVIVSFLGLVAWNSAYKVPDLMDFHVPSFLLVGLWAGTCLEKVLGYATTRWLASRALQRVARSAAHITVFTLVPALMILSNYERTSRRGYWEIENWARRTAAELKGNAVLAATGDTPTFAIWYVQAVHGLRTDVVVVEPDRFRDPWYLPMVRIESVRKAIVEATQQTLADVSDNRLTFGERCLYMLVKHVPPERSLYAYKVPPLLPPGVVALRHDPILREFVRLDEPAARGFLVRRSEKPEGTELLPGLILVRAGIGPRRVRRLEAFSVDFGWICNQPISPDFSVGLRLHSLQRQGARRDRYPAPSPVQQAPLVYGLPLGPTPPNREYHQKATFLADYELLPGRYAVTVMISKWDKSGRRIHRPLREVVIGQIEVLAARPGAL